jgi:hypothetical protein
VRANERSCVLTDYDLLLARLECEEAAAEARHVTAMARLDRQLWWVRNSLYLVDGVVLLTALILWYAYDPAWLISGVVGYGIGRAIGVSANVGCPRERHRKPPQDAGDEVPQ